MSERIDLRRVRLSAENTSHWSDALEGSYGQVGAQKYGIVLIKNVLFINLYKGADVDLILPTVHDGFLITSTGRRINVNDSKLLATLGSEETAQGQLMLMKWN